jgi:hypothetical protein
MALRGRVLAPLQVLPLYEDSAIHKVKVIN